MSEIRVDTISEKTTANGVSIDSVTLKDGGATLSDNLLFNASGKGVYLGVTSATASNLLDDYEEGTWTPEFDKATTPATYTAGGDDYGIYRKIGKMVFIQCRLDGTFTGGSGTTVIKGMPFNLTSSGLSTLSFYNLTQATGKNLRWRTINLINFVGVTYSSGDDIIISGTYATDS